jgi:hypothetical protein
MANNSGIVVRRTRVEWERLVRQWQRSGQTRREFGEAHRIRASTLSWWKWHLGAAPSAREPAPRLVPVEVVDRGPHDGSEWELTSASGHRLRVRGALTGADLRIVVDALTSGSRASRRR